MRTRNLIFIIGAIVVVGVTVAATLVILDSQRKEGVPFDGELVTVLVSTEDIPANQLMDPLVERGIFKQVQIPRALLVRAAVTDVDEVEGARATDLIIANEQISEIRLTLAECCGDQIDTPPVP